MSLAPGRRLQLNPINSLWYPRAVLVCVLLALSCLALGWLLLTLGTLQLSPAQVWDALLAGPEATGKASALWRYRLPRVVTGFATGACLGLAGLVFQSLSRNALGSPEIIGMVTGSALGAVAGITLFGARGWTVSAAAVIGCAAAAGLGYALAGRGPAMIARMVLIGIGLSATWSAATELLLTRTDPNIAVSAQSWLVGTLNARTWEDALAPSVALLACLPLVIMHARGLGVLDLGTDMASQVGLSVTGLTRVMVVVGVVLTGAAIAATGPISFISLAAAQLARGLAGTRTVPVTTTTLLGAALLLLAETVVSLLPETLSAPVGLATSALGGAYLLFFLMRRPK